METAVWIESSIESNCYILAEAGYALVIDPNDNTGPAARLEAHGWIPELIFLTHEHCDHMAGLESLRHRYPQACVLSTAACSIGLQDIRLNMSRRMEVFLAFQGVANVTYPPFICRPVDRTFEREEILYWRGHRLRCIPLPGHTAGSAGLILDEDTLFSGDYLIPEQAPLLRLPSGSALDYKHITKPFLDALPKGLRVCPGHGSAFVITEKELTQNGG